MQNMVAVVELQKQAWPEGHISIALLSFTFQDLAGHSLALSSTSSLKHYQAFEQLTF